VKEIPGDKLDIKIQIRSTYDQKLSATSLSLNIPLPPNTAEVEVNSTSGKGRYSPESNSVKWKSTSIAGRAQMEIGINVRCLPATSRATPATRLTGPITAEFTVPMFSASGLSIKSLKITEKSGYKPEKWVKYTTCAGNYEIYMTEV
jgi:AP-2 complex subunit mu-1